MAGTKLITYDRNATNTEKARAFTMLELLLVVVVLVALGSIVWSNIGQRTSAGKLEYAARQLAGLMQLARSEAMVTGNTHRCRFDAGGMRAIIEMEADPLENAGVFEPIQSHWSKVDMESDNIRCMVIEFDPWETLLREQEAKVLEKENEKGKEDLLPPITFHPDGTSDSATVLLGNKDGWNYTLMINGLTGKITVEQGNKIHGAEKQDKKESPY